MVELRDLPKVDTIDSMNADLVECLEAIREKLEEASDTPFTRMLDSALKSLKGTIASFDKAEKIAVHMGDPKLRKDLLNVRQDLYESQRKINLILYRLKKAAKQGTDYRQRSDQRDGYYD